jgi:hypothetical protein
MTISADRIPETVPDGYTIPQFAVKPVTPERQILIDAGDTINGERQDQYGNAEDSFEGIAVYWRNHIKMKYGIDVPLVNQDAAIMMTLFKLAREAHAPKRDNRLDGIGYLALTERMVD